VARLSVTAVVDLNLPIPMPVFCMKHVSSFRFHLGESIVKNRGLLRIYIHLVITQRQVVCTEFVSCAGKFLLFIFMTDSYIL
jgi:hypothetical protein